MPLPQRHREATVTVNGVTLTVAQTLMLRVALSSFLVDIGRDDNGAILDPANAGAIYRLYAEEGRAVEQMLVDGGNNEGNPRELRECLRRAREAAVSIQNGYGRAVSSIVAEVVQFIDRATELVG